MADLSVLFNRPRSRFAADLRFDAVEPAALEVLDAPVAPPAAADPLPVAQKPGFAEGFAAGLAQAEAASAAREALGFSFARLDARLAEGLRQRLQDTVVALCRATLAPLALDMPALARRTERAAAMFSRADDQRVIRLHPDDLAAVRELLPVDWTFLPDAALARGGLRVETQGGGAEDGPEQWLATIAEALELC